MRVFRNIFSTASTLFLLWLAGLWGIIQLLALAARSLFASGGFRSNIIAAFGKSSNQRKVLAVLRAFWPNISLRRKFVQAYENSGTALVTRRGDCLDVLSRDADFEVVYGSRMRELTSGGNFFLGMQPGWDYTRDTSAMHLAMRRSDVNESILPRAAELAESLVAKSAGKIDVPVDLTLQIPWDMTNHYFGTGGPDADTMKDWATVLFWYLFEDLGADPEFKLKAMDYAAKMRDYLDETIAKRKAAPSKADDVLNRCLALQAADTPGMDDPGIRNNLLGLLIGAIPTLSKASCFALDELLDRPEALKSAYNAAKADDDALLGQHIWEALRFNPHNPVIYRRATKDTVIAPASLRRINVKKGDMVFATTLSAMFDPYAIKNPNKFRTDRAWEDYIIWGYGMHGCFGAAINKAVIPAILKPLLKQKKLRRAVGERGQIDSGGTPHPQHFHLEFDV